MLMHRPEGETTTTHSALLAKIRAQPTHHPTTTAEYHTYPVATPCRACPASTARAAAAACVAAPACPPAALVGGRGWLVRVACLLLTTATEHERCFFPAHTPRTRTVMFICCSRFHSFCVTMWIFQCNDPCSIFFNGELLCGNGCWTRAVSHTQRSVAPPVPHAPSAPPLPCAGATRRCFG